MFSTERVVSLFILCVFFLGSYRSSLAEQPLELSLRYQQPVEEAAARFHVLTRDESWNPSETAVIICDMWDSHHCVNAVRRVVELAPRIDAFARELRGRGVTIIHAPSSCVGAYEGTEARERASSLPPSKSAPEQISQWCDQIPSEEAAAYPVDQSDGGEDDDPVDHRLWAESLEAKGLNPRAPWKRQVDVIHIDQSVDYISDSGTEIWSILESQGIENVILVGVHTNMCVLGRPFGLRRLAAGGKNVVLARDLTDTMYNPGAWPYVSHFSGTDLVIGHVERFVCPTIASSQVVGGEPFRFSGDRRVRLVMLVAEEEYETDDSLPDFAARLLGANYSVDFAWGSTDERHKIIGVQQLHHADALLVSVRRRALPTSDLAIVRKFVANAKPVIGIRTASHAFSLRNDDPPAGCDVWPEFDAQVFGGNYTGHHGNSLRATMEDPGEAMVKMASFDAASSRAIKPAGSLYQAAPLAPGAAPLLFATVENEPEQPIAWTFVRSDSGRSFYTSLGHPGDFSQPAFQQLLLTGINWACQVQESVDVSQIQAQNQRYGSGGGKQR